MVLFSLIKIEHIYLTCYGHGESLSAGWTRTTNIEFERGFMDGKFGPLKTLSITVIVAMSISIPK